MTLAMDELPEDLGDILASLYGTKKVAKVFEEVRRGLIESPLPVQERSGLEHEFGTWYEEQGAFFGTWFPLMEENDVGTWVPEKDANGLSREFNLFAMPVVLDKDGMTYNDTLVTIASLKDIYGHDGANVDNLRELKQIIRNGKYNGEWFLPSMGMLCDPSSNEEDFEAKGLPNGNLYTHRDKGVLRNVFPKSEKAKDDGSGWNWTCSDGLLDDNSKLSYMVENKGFYSRNRDSSKAKAWLVRAEPRIRVA